MRSRYLGAAAAMVTALVLGGCSSSTLDVPDATAAPADAADATPSAAAPVETPTPAVVATNAPFAVDCAAVLPAETVATTLDIPVDYVTVPAGDAETPAGTCSYSIAGNSAAVSVIISSGSETAEQLEARWQAEVGTTFALTERLVGDAALGAEADPSLPTPAVLLVASGGFSLQVVGYLGTIDDLVVLATDVFAAVDAPLSSDTSSSDTSSSDTSSDESSDE